MATLWSRVSDDVDVDAEMLRGHQTVPDLKSPVDEQAKYVRRQVGCRHIGSDWLQPDPKRLIAYSFRYRNREM